MFGKRLPVVALVVLGACAQIDLRDKSTAGALEIPSKSADSDINSYLGALLKDFRQTADIDAAAINAGMAKKGWSELRLKSDAVLEINYIPKIGIWINTHRQCVSPDIVAALIDEAGYGKGEFIPANSDGPREVHFSFVSSNEVPHSANMIVSSRRDCVNSVAIQ